VPWRVVTVGESAEPVVTMGGIRIVPDMVLAEVEPDDGDLLVLAGSAFWDEGQGDVFAKLAQDFLDDGIPVAAICGATAGLARAGLLDERKHTSAVKEYLQATGYQGSENYVDERAVVDGDLITAGPDSPVQFARATLQRLGLADERKLDAYEGVFHRADPAAYPILVG
jgi:putative intracellular protease/amidase